MRTFLSWPIRVHMCLLVLLLALPAIGVIIHSGIREREEAVAASSDEAEKLAHSIASEIQLLVDNTRQLSLTLSHLPDVQSRNAASLDPLLKELLLQYPYYASIFITDMKGVVWASSRPTTEGHSMADRRYFRDAVATGQFSAGEYAIMRVNGLPTISFGYPFNDKKGTVTGVIGIALDLRATEHLLVRAKLPAGASYVIFDHKGTFLFRGTDADRFMGKQDRPDLFKRMQADPDQGTFEARTNDMVQRRLAYRKLRLANGQAPYMFIRAGIPVESATRAANSALLKGLVLFAPFLFSALALGWLISSRCVVDRVHALQAVSRCLAAGDLSTRVAGRVSGGELGELAHTFDSMARSLQSHEQTLRASEKQVRRVLDGLFTFVGVMTPDGTLVEANRAALEAAGISSGDVVGRPFEETHWWSWSPQVQEQLREAIAKAAAGETSRYDVLLRLRNGHLHPVDFMLAPLRDDHGNITHLIPSAIDITARKQTERALQEAYDELEHRVEVRTAELASTIRTLKKQIAERKKAEQALRESTETFQQLILNSPSAMAVTLGEELRVEVLNKRFTELFGYTIEEVPDLEHWLVLAYPVDAYRDAVRAEWAARFAMAGDHRYQFEPWEKTVTCKDGSTRRIEFHHSFLGERVIFTFFDITDRRRAEEELKQETAQRLQALESLREQERIMIQQSRQAAMGEMISNIAHQWRQPLNTLGMLIQRLQLFHDMGEFSTEFLDTSTKEAMRLIKHMSGTIDDFSNFFKPDKAMVTFRVNETIRRTISLVEANFKHQQIRLTVHAEGDPQVNGYPNEYSQALLNILLNARDAFVERNIGGARITLQSFMDDDAAVVTIADNAGGIPEEVMEKIFDPHFTTKGPKGTGIGLFMAKNIIERNMNGRLTARNAGSGAEFRIEV